MVIPGARQKSSSGGIAGLQRILNNEDFQYQLAPHQPEDERHDGNVDDNRYDTPRADRWPAAVVR
jgi:hypothetical protein